MAKSRKPSAANLRSFEALYRRAESLRDAGQYRLALEAIDAALSLRAGDGAARKLRREIVEAELKQLARKGFASWSGVKPKAREHPAKLTQGPTATEIIRDGRR
jgi:hypothetical protein